MSTKSTGVRVYLYGWIARSARFIKESPKRFVMINCAVIGCIFSYEAMIAHQGRVPSPLVSNHLEYEMKQNGAWPRLGLVEPPKKADDRTQATMIIRQQQADERVDHWRIRNAERNWSILLRDHQKQKDSYEYRAMRSQDDDFSRNSYEGK
jgi:hypothetical protein